MKIDFHSEKSSEGIYKVEHIVDAGSSLASELLEGIKLALNPMQKALDGILTAVGGTLDVNKDMLLEERRDKLKQKSDKFKPKESIFTKADRKLDKIGLLDIGLVGGFLAATLLELNDLSKYWKALMFPETIKKVKTGWAQVKIGYDWMVTSLKESWESFKGMFKEDGKIAEYARRIKEWFADIKEGIFTKIGDVFESISKFFRESAIGRFYETLKTVFVAIGEKLAPLKEVFVTFGEVIKSLGTVFGKAWGIIARVVKVVGGKVIGLFLAVFDFFTGFFDGFKKSSEKGESLLENIGWGIFSGIMKVIKGFFIDILDLVKDFASWILEKLGLNKLSEILDSFTFAKLFDNLQKGLEDFIRNPTKVLNEIAEKFVKMALEAKDSFIDGILGLLAKIPGFEDKALSMMSEKGRASYTATKAADANKPSAPNTTVPVNEPGYNEEVQYPKNVVKPPNLNNTWNTLKKSASAASAVVIQNFGGNTTNNTAQTSVNNKSGSGSWLDSLTFSAPLPQHQ